MKKINKLFAIILTIAMLFTNVPIASAAGSASLGFSGSDSVTVGSTFDITLAVSNVQGATGGISGVNGKISYDADFLEYVGTASLAGFQVTYVDSSKKYAGFAVGNNITSSSSNLVKITFKAKKTGETTISTNSYKIVDGTSASLTVTASDKKIKITEPVPKSTNANLSNLGVTGYTLTPSFDKNTTEYRLNVPYSVSRVAITGTAEDSKARVVGVGNVNLNADQDNTFTVTCTAEDGTTKKQYKVIIHREKAPEVPKSSDNNLKGLGVSGYDIAPNFNKDTLEYNLTIPNDATEVIVNATPNDDKSQIKIEGNKDLKVGDNKVTVTVTAEDGSTKVYTINVKREEKKDEPVVEKDNDATLKGIYIGGFTLNPAFNKDTNVYSINVGEAVGGLNVTATPSSDKAKVEVIGNTGWQYGMNTVSIVVTAENGNKNTYIINVNRKSPTASNEPAKSDNSYLDSLVVNGANLSPAFNKDVSNYEVKIPYDMEKLDISYISSSDKAKVEILNNENLKVGVPNAVQVKVTAEDGSVRIYTINATRTSQVSQNNLKILSANGFSLSPSFSKDITNYKVKVNSNTTSLDLTAIAEAEDATVEISGNSDFKVGNNVVLIKVTDKNGFVKYYQIDVERPEASVMGMNIGHFLMLLFLGLGLIAVLFLLFLLLKRRKEKTATAAGPAAPTPVIDFKPEFNFGSRNGTDDDVVYPGGVLNQGNSAIPLDEPKKMIEATDYDEYENEDSKFDYLDETITKDELIAAIKEGMETQNSDKLKILLKQDELNQMKKEMRRKEEEKRRRSDRYDD